MEKLIQFMKDGGLTYREASSLIGMSASFLSEITHADEAKRKSPSLDAALKIQVATGGAVRVADWPKFAAVGRAIQSSNPSIDTPLTGATQ